VNAGDTIGNDGGNECDIDADENNDEDDGNGEFAMTLVGRSTEDGAKYDE
jgi:hypothetical protein